MTRGDLLNQRLLNQQISYSSFSKPEELVHWLTGIQAQDYMNSKWSMGVRIKSASDLRIEQALFEKSIIRTWLFRGTLHIVDARDIHWLLSLLSPRIIRAGKSRKNELGLDEKILLKCLNILEKLLKDGKTLTRDEIRDGFRESKIEAEGIILSHILQYSALNGQICFGPRKGNEFTFKLLDIATDTRSPQNKEEALGELASRYFTSHGPATLEDFKWWSGLSVKDSSKALEVAGHLLISDTFNQDQVWLKSMPQAGNQTKRVFLLPAFDSYLIAYRDRSAYLDNMDFSKVISSNGIFRPIIVQNGKIVGIWSRVFKKNSVIIETRFFNPPKRTINSEIWRCAEEFAQYLKKDLKHVLIDNKLL